MEAWETTTLRAGWKKPNGGGSLYLKLLGPEFQSFQILGGDEYI